MMVTSLNLAQFDTCLARAKSENIRLKATADAAVFHATSSRTGEVAYAVKVTGDLAGTCTCPAGINGTPCKHIAAALSAVEKQRAHEAAVFLARLSVRKRQRAQPVSFSAD